MVRRRLSLGSVGFDAFIILTLVLVVLIFLYPLYYIAIVSASGGVHVMRGDVSWRPVGFTLAAYRILLSDASIMRACFNTFLYTGTGTAINLALTALCAYPLSRKSFYGRKPITVFIIITMLFQGGMIPNYLIVYHLGLVDSLWALVLPPAINVWYMIIMRTFFQSIPHEIHESAFVDGANDLVIFIRIVLPLSLPVIATMIMFYAVWHWNSFFPAMIYLNDHKLYPVQLIMRSMLIDGSLADVDQTGDLTTVSTSIKYAVIIITVLPIVMIYPFIQKYFVKGAMVGSLKG